MKIFVLVLPVAFALYGCVPPIDGRWIRSSSGPEDIVVAPMAAGPTLITGTNPKTLLGMGGRGQLQAYTPGKDKEFHTIFQGGQSETFSFSPIGIALVENSEDPRWRGATLLYATNKSGQTVEVFEIVRDEVVHRSSLPKSALLADPNGIVAFPDGTVYVTDFGLVPKWGVERPLVGADYEGDPENTIVCYTPPDGHLGKGAWKSVAQGFNGCNGIAPGPSGTSLLVASLHTRRIWSIPRDPKTGELRTNGSLAILDLNLDFFPDNLKITAEGHYELAGHRNRIGTVFYFLFGLPLSRSSAVSFNWDGKTISKLLDHGELLNGHRRCASTMIQHDNSIYGGQPKCAGVFVRRIDQ